MKYGLVIDLLRCTGCQACAVACKAEQGTPAGISYNKVKLTEIGRYPKAKLRFLPISCMHCRKPKCVEVCPTEASYQHEDGIVLIDKKKCIGCGACVLACPYGSRTLLTSLNPYYEDRPLTPYERLKLGPYKVGTVVKCDFCNHRLEGGRLPACVETCPALARCFGDLDDPESEIAKLLKAHKSFAVKEERQTEPSIYYIRI